MRLIYWLLFAIYAANYLDRQIFSVLLEAMRLEFSLEDREMGLLSGFAFSIAYGIASIPAALFASTGNRRNIIAISAALWGTVTIACGFATSYAQLLFARSTIAMAEAASLPASHSILSDSVPSGARVRVFGHFISGSAVGALLAILVGGFVGHLYGWRPAMICAGILGVIPGLMLFMVQEPKRDYAVQNPDAPNSVAILRRVARTLYTNRRSRLVFAAETLNQIVLSGCIAWYPAFLVRRHGFSQIEAAATTSLGGLLAIAGTLISSRLIARLASGDPRWLARGPAITIAIGKPFSVIFLLADQPLMALLCFMVPVALSLSTYPPTLSLLHETVGPAERPIASALLISLATCIGLGVGPTFVGFVSSMIGGASSLNFALIGLHGFGLGAIFLYWLASSRFAASS